MQRPSYSAKAEYPVRRSFSFPSLMPRNTGSPAFAGDDGRECGALVFNEIAIDSVFKRPPSTHSVIAGHSRPKDGVASARLSPGNPSPSKMVLRRLMDDGLSPAKPSCAPDLDERSSDPAGRSFPGTARSIYGAHEVPTTAASRHSLDNRAGGRRTWSVRHARFMRQIQILK